MGNPSANVVFTVQTKNVKLQMQLGLYSEMRVIQTMDYLRMDGKQYAS